MIVGKLQDLRRYKGLNKNLDTAIDYVLNNDLLALAKGKYEIDGKNVIVNRDTYVAKEEANCIIETHAKYLDLQIVLKGKEYFGYTPACNPDLKVTTPYDDTKDLTIYSPYVNDRVLVVLEDCSFAIVFPEDAHLPKLKYNDELVEKAVVKVLL